MLNEFHSQRAAQDANRGSKWGIRAFYMGKSILGRYVPTAPEISKSAAHKQNFCRVLLAEIKQNYFTRLESDLFVEGNGGKEMCMRKASRNGNAPAGKFLLNGWKLGYLLGESEPARNGRKNL